MNLVTRDTNSEMRANRQLEQSFRIVKQLPFDFALQQIQE